MCPLVVKEFFISKQNVLFTTAANIAECAVNNDEIKGQNVSWQHIVT